MTLTLSAVIKTEISMAKDTKINQNSEHQISTIDSASDSTQFLIQKLEVKTRTEVFNKTYTPSSNKFLKPRKILLLGYVGLHTHLPKLAYTICRMCKTGYISI